MEKNKRIAPLFSVIIPAYNAENCIKYSIESVKKQKINEWEIIIVENGSSDGTTAICEEFISDERIKLFHSEKGVSNARNLGICESKGDWILFLDADDQLLDDTFQKYLDLFVRYTPEIVIGEYYEGAFPRKETNQLFSNESLKNLFSICLENPTKKCNVTGVAFCSSLIKDFGIKFDTSLKYAEDSVFFLQALMYANRVLLTSYPIYKYVYYPNSTIRCGRCRLDREYLPAITRVGDILDLSVPEIKNEWYLFILNQLLVIFVNDVFMRHETILRQIRDAREIMNIPEYKQAISNVDLSNIQGTKKYVFMMLKNEFMLGILLGVKIRQIQNRKRR